MNFLGIDWVGLNADNGRKLLLSIMFIAVLLGASWALRALAGLLVGGATRSPSATVSPWVVCAVT